MNAFDIINPKETQENSLPNGMEVLKHDDNAFSNQYTSGKSFDELEEKKVDENTEKGIRFSVDFKLHPDAVKKFDSVGQQIRSNCCVVQHNLVMHSFVYSLAVVKDCKQEGFLCKFSVLPVSHTYRYPIEMKKGGVPVTFKPEVPELNDVKFTVNNEMFFDLIKDDNGSYSCDTLVTLDSFKTMTKNGVAIINVGMTIGKEYFEIGNYVNLNLKEAHVVPNSYKILDKIFTGEKVPQCDWVFTVKDGSPSDFHVHGPVLADSSIVMRAAVVSHMSIGPQIAMISHENRLIFNTLKSRDMHVILTYIYHRRYVLPDFDAVSRVGQILSLLFRDEIPKFFESWEADLIKKVKTLDRSDTLKTVAECVRALIRVMSAPHGSMLGAYNVSLIVAADAWQMAEAKGKKVKIEKVKKEIGESWTLIDSILELIDDFKTSVCGTEKVQYV